MYYILAEVGSTEYKNTAVLLPVPTVLFQKWYRSTGTAVLLQKSIRYFQLFVINHTLKIKLSVSLANKLLTPKYAATVRSKKASKCACQ